MLEDTSGQKRSLADALKKGPVLLAFFKVSCPVCQFTFPFLERLQQQIKGRDDVRLWGVAQDDADDAEQFARQYGCTFPMLPDVDPYAVSNQYGLTTVPTLFLVQPDGQIQMTSVGFVKQELEAAAAELARRTGAAITIFKPTDSVPEFKSG
jgi:peroxiredoxin